MTNIFAVTNSVTHAIIMLPVRLVGAAIALYGYVLRTLLAVLIIALILSAGLILFNFITASFF